MRQEEELVRRAQQQDADAFAELVRRYEAACYRLAWQMTCNEQDAQELVLEAFLRVWRSLPSFRMQCSFGTWLYQLTSHVCLDFLRANGTRRALPLDPEWDTADPAPGPEAQVVAAEYRREVQRALQTLPAEQRLILTLRAVQDLSYEQIAEVTGLRVGTVKSRLARARRKMCAELGNKIASDPSKQEKGGGADAL